MAFFSLIVHLLTIRLAYCAAQIPSSKSYESASSSTTSQFVTSECNLFSPTHFVDSAVKSPNDDFLYVFSGEKVSKVKKRWSPVGISALETNYPRPIREVWQQLDGRHVMKAFSFLENMYLVTQDGRSWVSATYGGEDFQFLELGNSSLPDFLRKLKSVSPSPADALSFFPGNSSALFLVASNDESKSPSISMVDMDTGKILFSDSMEEETSAIEILGKSGNVWYNEGLRFSGNFYTKFLSTEVNFMDVECFHSSDVWFGCPQPICGPLKFDAVELFNEMIYGFIGEYVYMIEKSSRVVLGLSSIGTIFESIDSPVDAAVSIDEQMFLIRENDLLVFQYVASNNSWLKSSQRKISLDRSIRLPASYGAAVFDGEFVYLFSEDQYLKFSPTFTFISKGRTSVNLPRDPDAVMYIKSRNSFYFFKESVVFASNASFSSALERGSKRHEDDSLVVVRGLFQETFINCPSYLGEDYISNIKPFIEKCQVQPYESYTTLSPKDATLVMDYDLDELTTTDNDLSDDNDDENDRIPMKSSSGKAKRRKVRKVVRKKDTTVTSESTTVASVGDENVGSWLDSFWKVASALSATSSPEEFTTLAPVSRKEVVTIINSPLSQLPQIDPLTATRTAAAVAFKFLSDLNDIKKTKSAIENEKLDDGPTGFVKERPQVVYPAKSSVVEELSSGDPIGIEVFYEDPDLQNPILDALATTPPFQNLPRISVKSRHPSILEPITTTALPIDLNNIYSWFQEIAPVAQAGLSMVQNNPAVNDVPLLSNSVNVLNNWLQQNIIETTTMRYESNNAKSYSSIDDDSWFNFQVSPEVQKMLTPPSTSPANDPTLLDPSSDTLLQSTFRYLVKNQATQKSGSKKLVPAGKELKESYWNNLLTPTIPQPNLISLSPYSLLSNYLFSTVTTEAPKVSTISPSQSSKRKDRKEKLKIPKIKLDYDDEDEKEEEQDSRSTFDEILRHMPEKSELLRPDFVSHHPGNDIFNDMDDNLVHNFLRFGARGNSRDELSQDEEDIPGSITLLTSLCFALIQQTIYGFLLQNLNVIMFAARPLLALMAMSPMDLIPTQEELDIENILYQVQNFSGFLAALLLELPYQLYDLFNFGINFAQNDFSVISYMLVTIPFYMAALWTEDGRKVVLNSETSSALIPIILKTIEVYTQEEKFKQQVQTLSTSLDDALATWLQTVIELPLPDFLLVLLQEHFSKFKAMWVEDSVLRELVSQAVCESLTRIKPLLVSDTEESKPNWEEIERTYNQDQSDKDVWYEDEDFIITASVLSVIGILCLVLMACFVTCKKSESDEFDIDDSLSSDMNVYQEHGLHSQKPATVSVLL